MIGVVLFGATGCEAGGDAVQAENGAPNGREPPDPALEAITANSAWDATLSQEEIERGRLDSAWMRAVQLDSTALAALSGDPNAENWDMITAERANIGPMALPLSGDVEGPSVLRAQVLLDRVLFSPGIIDGHWGKNTEKAAYWLQSREGLPRTGRIDAGTYEVLLALAGNVETVRMHMLTEDDVAGPFVQIPDDIYAKAELECLCYESLTEKLAERFHTSPDLLEKLNPGIGLNELTAGSRIAVPNVRDPDAMRNVDVARIIVSGEGFYVHAVDAAGRILFHFPSTLGSTYDPSPDGNHRVVKVTPDPWWHYQPTILEHVDDEEDEAHLPPGPNNAVGVVWMALSIPHYGIHGTAAPETIGYTTSAGCVRLTNWDAKFLSERVRAGVPVEFNGTR